MTNKESNDGDDAITERIAIAIVRDKKGKLLWSYCIIKIEK